MKEKILSIMSCNVTTTSYKLQQLNLLREDAILAHDYESVKLADEHIESLQAVYRAGNETPSQSVKFFTKYDKYGAYVVSKPDEKFNIVIENGVDINKEYRTMKKERQHDLFEDMEGTTAPCVARAMQAIMPDVDFELEHSYDPKRKLTDEQKEAAENGRSTKRAIYTKHIKKFMSKVKYLGLAPTDLKYKQLYENAYHSAYMEVYGPYGRRNKLIQKYLNNGNYVVTKHCENCPMRYSCNESDIEVPISEKLVMKNVPVDKYCAVLSRHYDGKKAAEKKAAEEEKKAEIAEAKHLAAREALKELAEKTKLGHEANRALFQDDIELAKQVAIKEALERDTHCLVVDRNADVAQLEKYHKEYSRDIYGRIWVPSDGVLNKGSLEAFCEKKGVPVPTVNDIYPLLPDVSPAEEIGFPANSPLVITTATGADYEAIVNDIGTKAYPLVKTIIENKVRLPKRIVKFVDKTGRAIVLQDERPAREMNSFDIELSGRAHSEVATILSELYERMHEARDFFENCTDKPFVDKGVVPTGTKTEPFYIKHLFDMFDDFDEMRDVNHIDETPIGKEEYEELGLPCHLNEDGIYVTTQVATYRDEDDIPHECEFETTLTRDDYDHMKFYKAVYRTPSITVPYATKEDISRHQDEVMKAEASGTNTIEYQNMYQKMLLVVDTKWIANLLKNKFFDQSETRWRRVSLSKIKVEIDDSEDFAPRGSIQLGRPNFQKKDRDVRVNDMVRPELGEGAKTTYVSDVLDIISYIKNLRKAIGWLSDKEVAMLQQTMGSNYREFVQLLAFTDIVKKLEAVLVRNIGETYVVDKDSYLDMVSWNYMCNEEAIVAGYVNTLNKSRGNNNRMMTYVEYRKMLCK